MLDIFEAIGAIGEGLQAIQLAGETVKAGVDLLNKEKNEGEKQDSGNDASTGVSIENKKKESPVAGCCCCIIIIVIVILISMSFGK